MNPPAHEAHSLRPPETLSAKRPSVMLGCGFCSDETPVTLNLSKNPNLWVSCVRWSRAVGGGPLGPLSTAKDGTFHCTIPQVPRWPGSDLAQPRCYPQTVSKPLSAPSPGSLLQNRPLAYSQPCLHTVMGASPWSPKQEGSSTISQAPAPEASAEGGLARRQQMCLGWGELAERRVAQVGPTQPRRAPSLQDIARDR